MKRKLLIGLFGFFFIVGACNALAKKSNNQTVSTVKAVPTVTVVATKTHVATKTTVPTFTQVIATATIQATVTVVVKVRPQATAKAVQATKVVVVEDKAAYPCKTGQIKGSVNGKYHVPGGRDYKRTKKAMCFDTVDQAKAAGYVAAANP